MRCLCLLACVQLVWSAGAAPAGIESCREAERSDRAAAKACFEALLADASPAVRAEAAWALGDVAAANRAFHIAVRAAADDPQMLVRRAELFVAVHQAADAEALFQEALAIDPQHIGALMGQAQNALGRFDQRARTLAQQVLEIAPNHAGAHLLLARLALEVGRGRARSSAAGRASCSRGCRHSAASDGAGRGDRPLGRARSQPWEARVGELHASYGDLYETIAYFYVIVRRYREAVAQLERAVALHPELWSAHATLGLNLLRVNRFHDARAALELAHRHAPYNAEVANTLRLLDDN